MSVGTSDTALIIKFPPSKCVLYSRPRKQTYLMHDETIQAASGARAHPDNAHQYTILSSSLYSRSSPPNARFDLDEFFARDQTDAHGVMYDEIRLHHSTRARVSTPPAPTPYCPFRLSPCTPPGPTHDSISMSSWHVIKLRPTDPCDEASYPQYTDTPANMCACPNSQGHT